MTWECVFFLRNHYMVCKKVQHNICSSITAEVHFIPVESPITVVEGPSCPFFSWSEN